MSYYYLPDPTGSNPDYLKVNVPFYVYQSGLRMPFSKSPIFAHTLVIKLTDGTARTLVRDVDWTVQDEDIDVEATAQAFAENRDFPYQLVKSVTFISELATLKQVARSYQEYYMTSPGLVPDDGRELEFSPSVLQYLLSSVAGLNQRSARVTSPIATNLNPPKLLAFDINKERTANRVTNELVTINTMAGATVVALTNGAFFADSLVIRAGNITFSPSTDYQPIGFSPLSQKSTNKSGIYTHIAINRAFAGPLSIDYHAVGGTVQPQDIASTYGMMLGIRDYLDNSTFITEDSVITTPAFRALDARQSKTEDIVRRLLSGSPSYGDANTSTPSVAVTRPIIADDSQHHWFTIATLYQVQGSTDIIEADAFSGRVYFPDSKISLTFDVDFNKSQQRNPVSFTTRSLVMDPNYVAFSDLAVDAPQYPLVRVIWNYAAESFSGACIQVGIPLPNLTDLMVVENFSSQESCWKLSRVNEQVPGSTMINKTRPDDNNFMLPDLESMWSQNSSVSRQVVCVPEYKPGYLVYTGSSLNLATLTTISDTSNMFGISLPQNFPVSAIQTLEVTLASQDAATVYKVPVELTGTSPTVRQGSATFMDTQDSLMSLDVTLTLKNDGSIGLNVHNTVGANPMTNTPSTKTDIVRYITAKV